MAIPYYQKLQREGESGRTKINQITRYLTVLITAFQAPGYLANLVRQLPAEAITPFDPSVTSPTTFFWISSTIILVSGTMFVMWLGEKITDKGIGNGISLIIMIGIIARLPFALFGEFISRMEEQGGGLVIFVVEIAIGVCHPAYYTFGKRDTENTGAVCQACCRKQTIRRGTSVHSA
jgi:preprotein translocase subunit SecY